MTGRIRVTVRIIRRRDGPRRGPRTQVQHTLGPPASLIRSGAHIQSRAIRWRVAPMLRRVGEKVSIEGNFNDAGAPFPYFP